MRILVKELGFYGNEKLVLTRLCEKYKARKNAFEDLVFLQEFATREGMVDVATLDLKTWILRGFEIKMSRQDYLTDKKWYGYLPFFNYFWFAIPNMDVIKPEEIENGIGLLILEREMETDPAIRFNEENNLPKVKRYYLKEIKKAKKLQPIIIRRSFGEHHMVMLLAQMLRAYCWRHKNTFGRGIVRGIEALVKELNKNGIDKQIIEKSMKKAILDQDFIIEDVEEENEQELFADNL